MIALYKGTSALSRLIRWRTWSDYTHAAWVFPDGSVIEAWKGGVTHAPGILSGHAPDTQVHLYALNLTVEQRWAVQDFLIAQIGKPYDYAGVLGFLTASKTENPNRWFCSELIFAACKRAGINLFRRIPAWKVSPGLLSYAPALMPVTASCQHPVDAEMQKASCSDSNLNRPFSKASVAGSVAVSSALARNSGL